jgi:phosphate transport system permease protein
MNLSSRQKKQKYFIFLCRTVTYSAIIILGILLFHIVKEGFNWLNIDFLSNFPSRFPEKAGIKSALYGSLWLITMTAIISAPLGIATAFYLEEYAPKKSFMRWIQINISNLAGMPSIVYGLIGLAIFVRYFDLEDSLWSGALTLSLLILPVIIISSQEAIRAVPDSIRYAAYSLGARRWQLILGQILPAALPGIMTGLILSISRAIGETAPLIMIGALSYVAFVPEGPSDPFTVLPVQIYNWAGRPQAKFHGLAGAGIIVLLVVLFTMNFGAVLIRQRFQRYK